MDVGLSAKTGFNGHDQNHIAKGKVFAQFFGIGFGLDRKTCFATKVANGIEGGGDI